MQTLQHAEMLAGVVQQLSTVLKGRLTLKNAHKQWLALELVQEVSAVHLKVVSRCSGGDLAVSVNHSFCNFCMKSCASATETMKRAKHSVA